MDIKGPGERRKKREQIRNELMTTSQIQDLLGFTRVRVHQLVKEGKLEPIHHGTFLKDDVYAYKVAYEQARANNKWLKEFE